MGICKSCETTSLREMLRRRAIISRPYEMIENSKSLALQHKYCIKLIMEINQWTLGKFGFSFKWRYWAKRYNATRQLVWQCIDIVKYEDEGRGEITFNPITEKFVSFTKAIDFWTKLSKVDSKNIRRDAMVKLGLPRF